MDFLDVDKLAEAGKLMLIGMTSVFCVLCLVILMGNLLISFVNKYCPEEEKPAAPQSSASQSSVNSKVAAVINAAIQQKFAGKAVVEKIEKI